MNRKYAKAYCIAFQGKNDKTIFGANHPKENYPFYAIKKKYDLKDGFSAS